MSFSSVLPAKPTNVSVTNLTSSHATLRWNLSIFIPDETPDSVRVTLLYSNGSTASAMPLNGTATMAVLKYLPGLDYQVNLMTKNMDGSVMAAPVSFRAPYGGEWLPACCSGVLWCYEAAGGFLH